MQVREGAPLASALAGKKRFPGLLAMFARLGEQTGKLPEMLAGRPGSWARKCSAGRCQMATILEPLLMVVMGGGGDGDRAGRAPAHHPAQHLGEVARGSWGLFFFWGFVVAWLVIPASPLLSGENRGIGWWRRAKRECNEAVISSRSRAKQSCHPGAGRDPGPAREHLVIGARCHRVQAPAPALSQMFRLLRGDASGSIESSAHEGRPRESESARSPAPSSPRPPPRGSRVAEAAERTGRSWCWGALLVPCCTSRR